MRSKDFLLKILKNSPVFSALTILTISTSWANPEKVNPAWNAPNWGFKKVTTTQRAHPLAHSLIFDQKFDKVSYRPAPKVYVSMPLIPSGPVEEAPKKVVAAKEIENVLSPFFVERALPVSRVSQAPKAPDVATEQAIQNVIDSRQQEKVVAQAPTPAPAAAPQTVQTQTQTPPRKPFNPPKAVKHLAQIVVINEESMLNRDPQTIAGAKIHWTGYRSGLITESDANGVARPPYPNVQSMRFVVEAEGYVPALGYAVSGVVTPVVLYPIKRRDDILKTLNIVPEAGKTVVLGKVLDRKMRPLSGVTIDASLQAPGRVYYSAGSFGVFHPGMKETGAQGDFLISGLRAGLQYVMPTQTINPAELLGSRNRDQAEAPETKEWPSFIGDFSSLPEVVSLAVQEGARADLKSQIVDAMSMEKPASGVHLTIGGQRGLFIPDEEGFVRLKDLFLRPSVDVIEVHSPGYLKSWSSPVASAEIFPDPIQMFSKEQLLDTFQGVSDVVDLNKGVALIQLRPEKFARPVRAEVYSSQGKKGRRAQVFYFDDNGLNHQLQASVPKVGGIGITNLDDGEWHVLLIDEATQLPVSGQILRVQKNTVTQLQF